MLQLIRIFDVHEDKNSKEIEDDEFMKSLCAFHTFKNGNITSTNQNSKT